MSRYLTIFVSPLVYLISFLAFFYYGKYPLAFAIFCALVIMVSLRLVTKYHFWQNKLLFVNLLLSYVSQFLFLILLTPVAWRYIMIFVLAFVWGLIWWLISRHFTAIRESGYSEYLSSLKFFYYINFWFLAVSLYALIFLVQFSIFYILPALVLSSVLWFYQIWQWEETRPKYEPLLLVLLMLQMAFVVYLLPVSFYVSGTIMTLWLFFIADKTVANLRHWRLYLGLMTISIIILLFT